MLQLGGLSEDKATILDLGQRLGGLLQEMHLAVVVDTSALLSELDESFSRATCTCTSRHFSRARSSLRMDRCKF